MNDIIKNTPSSYTKPSDDDKFMSINCMNPEFSRNFDISRLPLHMISKIQIVHSTLPEFEKEVKDIKST